MLEKLDLSQKDNSNPYQYHLYNCDSIYFCDFLKDQIDDEPYYTRGLEIMVYFQNLILHIRNQRKEWLDESKWINRSYDTAQKAMDLLSSPESLTDLYNQVADCYNIYEAKTEFNKPDDKCFEHTMFKNLDELNNCKFILLSHPDNKPIKNIEEIDSRIKYMLKHPEIFVFYDRNFEIPKHKKLSFFKK